MKIVNFTDRQLQFLKLVCSDDTYHEIADKMCVSKRTVDGYRDELLKKLKLKSRTGLVLYSIKNKIVKI